MRTSRSTLPVALLVSGVLHAALLAVALVPEPAHAGAQASAGADRPDQWAGDTFDVELLDGPAAPAEPSPIGPEPAPTGEPQVAARPLPAAPPSPAAPVVPGPPLVPNPEIESTVEPAPPRSPPPSAAPVESAEHTGSGPDADHSAATDEPPSHASVDASDRGRSTGTSFGAQGPGGAVRQLGRAFTRALPAAALPKDGWLALPPGVGPEVRVTLTLDESGQLLVPDFGKDPVPRELRELVRRAHLLLKRGRFAIGEEPGAGSETFSLRVEASDEAPTDDTFAEPGHIMRRGFEPPHPDRPGRAHFTFASGRHVVVHVELVR